MAGPIDKNPKNPLSLIGKILKPHGVKGEMTVQFSPAWSNSKNFRKQKVLFAGIYRGDDPVPFFIDWAETDDKGLGRIKFEDFNRVESIRDLIHKELFVFSELVSKKTEIEIQGHELIGFLVSDSASGDVGVVNEIIENKNQQTLVLKRNDKEILIPFVKDFIIRIEKQKKIILMNIPDGLIDLNS